MSIYFEKYSNNVIVVDSTLGDLVTGDLVLGDSTSLIGRILSDKWFQEAFLMCTIYQNTMLSATSFFSDVQNLSRLSNI